MKPIFSNLMAYETTLHLPPDFADLVEKEAFDTLARNAYTGAGFAELSDGQRHIKSDDRVLVRFLSQEKHINKAALDAMLQERLGKIEGEGRELSGQETWQLKEQLERELLPYSPISSLSCYVMFCPFENRIYLSCSSESTAETVLSFIRRMLGSLPVWPVTFYGDVSFKFRDYIARRGDMTPALPGVLSVDIYGALVCSGEKGKKVSTSNLCFRDKSIETLIEEDNLYVRSIDISLKSSDKKDAETEATLKLSMPSSGAIILKKFDYEMSSAIQLDASLANEEGEGDLIHQYTIEMLVVGRYTARIFDALAEFTGGYFSREKNNDNDSNDEDKEESSLAIPAGADE